MNKDQRTLTSEAWRFLVTQAAGPGAFAYRFFVQMDVLQSISDKLKRPLTLNEVKELFKRGPKRVCALCGAKFTETIFAVLSAEINGSQLTDFIVGWEGQSYPSNGKSAAYCGRLYKVTSQGREFLDTKSCFGAVKSQTTI